MKIRNYYLTNETVEDELSRGWLDDSSIEFLRLLKGDKATIIDGEGC